MPAARLVTAAEKRPDEDDMTVVLSLAVCVNELTDVPYTKRGLCGAYGVTGTRLKTAFRVAPETPISVAGRVVTAGSSPPAPPPDVSQFL